MANCRFQRKCGKCWANGHIGTNCTKVGSATVAASAPGAALPRPVAKLEPGFDELLSDPMPYPQPLMPEGRPQKVDCFIERDEDYFLEMEALSKAVVVYNLGFKRELSVDTVANYAVKSGLVTKNDIQVSALPGSKYLIRLPPSVPVEAFIKATPYEAWEEGLSFQQWTPLEDADTVIPRFKILLELIGVPTILWREQQIVKAVSQFGVFLGTMESEECGSLKSWMVAVGTYDLAKIPHTIDMHVGGMKFPVTVRPVTWKRSVLYKAEDFPTLPVKFPGPPKPVQPSASRDSAADEIIPLSKSSLIEVCKGKAPSELPPELRQFATEPENNHGERLHERLHDNKGNDQLVGETGRICHLGTPATRRLQGSSNTKRNLFHEGKANSIGNISQESRVRCTPGFNETQNDVMDEVVSPIKVNSPRHHEVPHEVHQHHSAKQLGIQPPRLMRRNSGNCSDLGVKSAVITPHQNAAQKEGSLIPAPNVAKKGNNLKQKEVVKEANLPPSGNNMGSQNSSTEYTLKEFKFKAQQKRKKVVNEAGPSRPPKPMPKFKKIVAGSNLHPLKTVGPKTRKVAHPISNRPSKRAQVQLNPEGYYEVRVNSTHVQNLASGCGFKSDDIQHIIAADNVARVEEQKKHQSDPVTEDNDEDPIIDSDLEEALARFDPDPADDLESDDEN